MKYSILILLVVFTVACSSPKPRKPVSRSTTTFLEKSIARNKTINKTEEEFFKKMIKNDSLHTYKASNTGFWYCVDKQIDTTNNNFPVKGNEVIINYEIKDINNNVIYSKEELGLKNQKEIGDRPYKVDGEEFITGLQEGIKLMRLGQTVTFLFPSNKVFGASGFQDRIKPNQPLIITVYLKEIKNLSKNTNNKLQTIKLKQ